MNPGDVKRMIGNAMLGMRQALRGILNRTSATDQVILAQVTGLRGESFNGAEVFQQAGFRSNPLPGMQPIIIPLNGKSANGVVVAMSNGKLFITDLQPGEVAIFNENEGAANSIILRNGKIININCDTLNVTASTAINMKTSQLNVAVSDAITSNAAMWNHTGPVNTDGNVAVDGTVAVTGLISGAAGISVSGGESGVGAVIAGNVTVSSGSINVQNGDVVASGISATKHIHPVPDGMSGGPQ